MKITAEQRKERERTWQRERLPVLMKKIPLRIQEVLQKPILSVSKPLSESMYVFGRARTGKSVRMAENALIWSCTQFVHRRQYDFIFITCTDLLAELRDSYNNPDISEKQILDKYKNVQLLVLDDIGVAKTTEWAFQMMYTILAYRYDNRMTTYYTCNLSLEELAERLQDDRLTSRIAHECGNNIFEFDNEPYI